MTSRAAAPEGRHHMTVTAGDRQAARSGRPFAAQLRVALTDGTSAPIAGATVTFRILAGPAAFGRAARAVSAITDRAGVAIAPLLTAGRDGGLVTVTATEAGGTALPAGFALRVMAPEPRPGPAPARLRR